MNNDIKDLLNRYMPGYEGPVEQVTGSGSNRIYLRLQNDSLGTFMAVYGSCVLLFGGLGLITAFIVELKLGKKR